MELYSCTPFSHFERRIHASDVAARSGCRGCLQRDSRNAAKIIFCLLKRRYIYNTLFDATHLVEVRDELECAVSAILVGRRVQVSALLSVVIVPDLVSLLKIHNHVYSNTEREINYKKNNMRTWACIH